MDKRTGLVAVKAEPVDGSGGGGGGGKGGTAAAEAEDTQGRHAQYVQLFSAPFSRQQFDELKAHYYVPQTAPISDGSLSTRSGRARTADRQGKAYTMIERAPPEARAELDRKLKAGEDVAALNIMRALRYFEMYPCHICHGALPPWGTCLLNSADVVDLSHETVDVDSFIVDVLMTKVVKAEPGRARALVKPEPGLEAGSLIGTEVRKRFPGVGWYDGVVLDASGGGSGSSSMAEVQWHDGSITDMKITDVQKYAKVAAERADPTKRTAGVGSGPNKRPAEKTALLALL